jgi:hypothetical protein
MKTLAALGFLALAALCGPAEAVIPSLMDAPEDLPENGAEIDSQDWHSLTGREKRARSIAVNQRIRAIRERSLYVPNLTLGLVAEIGSYEYKSPYNEWEGDGDAMTGMAISLRQHYRKAMGLQGTLELATAGGYEARQVTAEVKHLFGPWARFQLEPGLGYTRGWSRRQAYRGGPEYTAHLESVHMVMDCTVYMGNRLQVPVTTGFRASMAGDGLGTVHVKAAYALPLE